jgi:hypothetical protein
VTDAGFAGPLIADPVAVIVGYVTAVEHALDGEQVRQVVTAVAGGRAKRRRLAAALAGNPGVLTCGRPPAPCSVGQLLLALRRAGAQQIAAPRCGGCDRRLGALISSGPGTWVCSGCRRTTSQPCGGCGKSRPVVTRDRAGNPRCRDCPDDEDDPVQALLALIAGLDPAVSGEQVLAAVQAATARPAVQRRLAWAVADNPALLTGDGADAPAPVVLALIDALITAGVTGVVRPSCPRCHRVVALPGLLEGRRVCRACYARARAVPCGRCSAMREPAARDAAGRPLCANCLVTDPVNLEECTGCGRRRRVTGRTLDGPLCENCQPKRLAICSICGQTRACEISEATRQPWCLRCQKWWTRCTGCGTVAPVRGGTRQAPLCARCLNPDPAFWGRCPVCKTTWQLSTCPCQRCALNQKIWDLLGGHAGQIRADLVPFQQALAGVERPGEAAAWLSRPKVREILTGLAADRRPLTHQVLDELPASKTLSHLRSVLVAAGALPARDERLASLQRWTSGVIGTRGDPAERQILHRYAIWHHLRRLRQRLADAPASQQQVQNVRRHVTAAAGLLAWLAAEGLTLAACTQADLDRWATAPTASNRDETSHFIRWAVRNHHATRLTSPARRWEGPRGPHDTEQRWADARRLLGDDTLDTADRVAGLLVLLYAQHITAISQLTVDHVRIDGDNVSFQLGTVPIVLPGPMAALALELVATRRGSSLIGAPATTPWLFPGGRPGQPIGDYALAQRLQHIGLHPLQDRSTALFALATELPAAILARMLGIHTSVAAAWQRSASGDWMNYAAQLARRDPQQPVKEP